MKKNDMALIILIISISLVVGYFIGQAIVGSPKKKASQVEVVQPISSTVTAPDKTIFNRDAINPAVPIQIGSSSNQPPFTGN